MRNEKAFKMKRGAGGEWETNLLDRHFDPFTIESVGNIGYSNDLQDGN